MIRFERWGPFEREFERLARKFRSLPKDLARFEQLIAMDPTGQSQSRVTLHQAETVTVVKARLFCEALRRNSLRIIYAYHADRIAIVWIEVYHKADKVNEDRARIAAYLREAAS